MTTFSSNQEKMQGAVDPILVLISIALIGILVAVGPLNGSVYNFNHNAWVAAQGNPSGKVSLKVGNSFTSNLQYWNAECSHGWTSNSTCDALSSMAQSCVVGLGTRSDYCSEYDSYLQLFHGR